MDAALATDKLMHELNTTAHTGTAAADVQQVGVPWTIGANRGFRAAQIVLFVNKCGTV
jgi:hypothetical protein